VDLVVQVTNGTPSGASVVGDEVTVSIYVHNEKTTELTGTVGDGNEAVFENIPVTEEHTIAVPNVKHQEMRFSGKSVLLGEDLVSAQVQVFDVLEDTSVLSVGAHHIMLSASGNVLNVGEFMQLRNSSTMAVRTGRRDEKGRTIALHIALPEGFNNLQGSQYFKDDALVVTDQGFYDTMAMPPGEFAASFNYALPITGRSVSVRREISLATSSLIIFAELGQARLTGFDEPPSNMVRESGQAVEYYALKDLSAGDVVSFQITGFNVSGSESTTLIVLGVVLAAVIVLIIFRLRSVKQ
jgi:hypothetical protein